MDNSLGQEATAAVLVVPLEEEEDDVDDEVDDDEPVDDDPEDDPEDDVPDDDEEEVVDVDLLSDEAEPDSALAGVEVDVSERLSLR